MSEEGDWTGLPDGWHRASGAGWMDFWYYVLWKCRELDLSLGKLSVGGAREGLPEGGGRGWGQCTRE